MRRNFVRFLILASLVATAPAWAEDAELPRVAMAPGEPQARSVLPGTPMGAPATSEQYVLDYHGYVHLPMRLGVHEREPAQGQPGTVLHTPALVPQDYRRFQYTAVMPDPWLQLDLSYGNSTVSGTVIMAATSVTDAEAAYNPVQQIGVTDAYLSLNLSKPIGTPVEVRVGAMTGRYGAMGAYDAGYYGTPLIARINSIGETITAGARLGKVTLVVEQGIGGQLGRPDSSLVSSGWNDFADPNTAASYVSHVHGGVGFMDLVQVGLHYVTAWCQDDQSLSGTVQRGRITVLGADARLTAGQFGHLYLGYARTMATNAEPVSGIIEVLNASGGRGLVREYLGPNSQGDGELDTFGAQYNLSLSRLVFPDAYHGHHPDVALGLFGIGTKVHSDDPAYDGILKLKGGAEVTYSMLSWFALSGRFDHVRLDNDVDARAFSIWTGRALFHTDWMSRDEIALQYSHLTYGREVYVSRGYPPVEDPGLNPDQHVLSLSGTFWW